ncbi:unnamed protein product [Mycena citricolor]|uniref:Uncharacterized protein n=1 Tax=Mycena citricolor TaxID=2018698 RepID=A0AAD2HTR6_9AGAR|nr:unnamed protein product [Mycena citricolor]
MRTRSQATNPDSGQASSRELSGPARLYQKRSETSKPYGREGEATATGCNLSSKLPPLIFEPSSTFLESVVPLLAHLQYFDVLCRAAELDEALFRLRPVSTQESFQSEFQAVGYVSQAPVDEDPVPQRVCYRRTETRDPDSLNFESPWGADGAPSDPAWTTAMVSQTVELLCNPPVRRGDGRKRTCNSFEQRRDKLVNDPWAARIECSNVRCRGCAQLIKSEGRDGMYLYPFLWNKHRDRCDAVRRVRLQHGATYDDVHLLYWYVSHSKGESVDQNKQKWIASRMKRDRS